MINEQKRIAVEQPKKFISISSKCNNNCIFCLGKDVQRKESRFEKFEDIEKELKDVKDIKSTKLIISGVGEASIHPDIIKIITLASKLGFPKIQTVTNGRMFSYTEFLDKCIKAGLDEITFSIHGHNAELHDNITRVQGSFLQAVKAIKNALKRGIIVNADVVLNKKNIKHFPEIISFLLQLGVREFDILHIVPFGNAWENWNEVYYDLSSYVGYLHQGIELAKRKGAVIWANRLPPEFLYGYEDLIQSPKKLMDEFYGRKDMFKENMETGKDPNCRGERCKFCYINDLCKTIFDINKSFRDKTASTLVIDFNEKKIDVELKKFINDFSFEILRLKNANLLKDFNAIQDLVKEHKPFFEVSTKEDLLLINQSFPLSKIVLSIKDISKKEAISLFSAVIKQEIIAEIYLSDKNLSILDLVEDFLRRSNVSVQIKLDSANPPKITKILERIKDIKEQFNDKIILNDFPFCLIGNLGECSNSSGLDFDFDYVNDSILDVSKVTQDYIKIKKVKTIHCKECSYNVECDGVFYTYAVKHGYKEFLGIK